MGENIREPEEANRLPSRMTAHEEVTEEVEEATKRLKIRPGQVLESLEHLRIEKSRIKPLESNDAPKEGGKANVEKAILVPREQSSTLSESDDEEYVAVKKLRFGTNEDNDRVLAPFAHEVDLLNDLSHQGAVKIVGFVEDVEVGIAWIIFSWEKNGNLRDFIQSANWELPERVSLINDVAGGLSYLHGRKPPICHGDLKSLNILVNSGNRAVITDFGSARTLNSATEAASQGLNASTGPTLQHRTPAIGSLKLEVAASGDFVTITGPAYTVQWAASEVLEGRPPGLASDIWALGWVCWEAFTGTFPFENDRNIYERIMRGNLKLPAVADNAQLKQIVELCSLMEECWRLDTNERPTAIRCQQIISFMDQVTPSGGEGKSLAATRSSGLLYALGWIQLRNGRIPAAGKYFQDSFDVAKSAGDKEGMAKASQALGGVWRMQDEYSKAEEADIHARGIYSQIGSRHGFAQSLRSLGDVYLIRNEYSKAEESYTQARDIYSQIQYQFGLAQSVWGLGGVYYMQNEYVKAEESYIQARDIYSQIGYQLGFAQSFKALGDLYCMRNEDSKAKGSYIKARDIYSQIGNRLGFAHSVKGLGDVYYMQDKYSEAEESYTQVREIYSQIGDQLGSAESAKGLGDVYYMQNQDSKAEYLYTQALKIYSKIGNQLGYAHSVQALGRVYSAQGKYAAAEKSYLQAQSECHRIGNMRSLANNLWYFGWLRRRQARYGEAQGLVCEASRLYGTLGLKGDAADCNDFLEQVRQLMTM